MSRPMRATIACRMSPPIAAEVTARKGNAESTASAAKANELFMKSTVESWFQNLPGALSSNRSSHARSARTFDHPGTSKPASTGGFSVAIAQPYAALGVSARGRSVTRRTTGARPCAWRPASGSGRRLLHDDNRAGGVVDDLLADRSEQQA